MSRLPVTYSTEDILICAVFITLTNVSSFFVIREKRRPKYEITACEDVLEGTDNVLQDQTIRFTGKRNCTNYPSEIRRIVYYSPEMNRTFTYYTNNFYLKASDIALLYKNRWKVELFFKFLKQHLRVKSFWGNSENAVRIQIYVAIITYCLVAIIESELKLNRDIYEVMRILGSSMLVKDNIKELFSHAEYDILYKNDGQLELDFTSDNAL